MKLELNLMLISLICFTLSLAFGVLFLFPYLIYPLILRRFKTKPIATARTPIDNDGSRFAAFFCAFNEIQVIDDKILNLAALRARYPELELWAYDDGSTDGTAEALESAGLDINVVRGAGRTGKAHGMKLMITRTERELLVFTDANVMLDPDALDELQAAYGDPEVGGVCGALHYVGTDGTSTEQVGGLYWRLEEHIKDQESRSGSVMGADGSIFSVRREVYPDFPDTVQDDFTVSMAVLFAGKRLVKSNQVIAYEQLVASRSLEWSRKIRIAVRAFHTYLVMVPKVRQLGARDRFCFASHKWLRWHGGVALGLSILFLIASMTFFSILLGAGIVVGLCIILFIASKSLQGPVAAIYEILISVLATSIGVTKARQGQTQAVWNPPR